MIMMSKNTQMMFKVRDIEYHQNKGYTHHITSKRHTGDGWSV